jgi:hypothetical protein
MELDLKAFLPLAPRHCPPGTPTATAAASSPSTVPDPCYLPLTASIRQTTDSVISDITAAAPGVTSGAPPLWSLRPLTETESLPGTAALGPLAAGHVTLDTSDERGGMTYYAFTRAVLTLGKGFTPRERDRRFPRLKGTRLGDSAAASTTAAPARPLCASVLTALHLPDGAQVPDCKNCTARVAVWAYSPEDDKV